MNSLIVKVVMFLVLKFIPVERISAIAFSWIAKKWFSDKNIAEKYGPTLTVVRKINEQLNIIIEMVVNNNVDQLNKLDAWANGLPTPNKEV